MANKLSPNSLIHCAECGEDYSATYKRCPFCGAKNAPRQANPDRSASGTNLEDTYVFDGQGLFDEEGDEDYVPAGSRGGKRLAGKPMSNPFANADINWPRAITFVCSLVIIVAAMIIVFTVIYPQLRGNPTVENSQNPSSPATDPAGEATESADPNVTEPGTDATDPVTEPSASVAPTSPAGLLSISFPRENDADFTLNPGASHTIRLSFTPASWSGTVTWSSTDTTVATVDANGTVTNVNTSGKLRSAVITATADGLSLESKVYCKGTAATEPRPALLPPVIRRPAPLPPPRRPPARAASPWGRRASLRTRPGVCTSAPRPAPPGTIRSPACSTAIPSLCWRMLETAGTRSPSPASEAPRRATSLAIVFPQTDYAGAPSRRAAPRF